MNVELNMRVPGCWVPNSALSKKLPKGYRMGEGTLELPNGESIMLRFLPRDDQFVTIFRRACHGGLSASALEKLEGYTCIAGIVGPGGSMESARTMVQAAAALLQAGGLGVFIDNSAVSHGRKDWLEIAKDGCADALCFGFLGVVGGQKEIWSTGLHAFGFPDIVLHRTNPFEGSATLIEFARFVSARGQAVDEGFIYQPESGPKYKVERYTPDDFKPTSPIHNPFGRIRLVPLKT